jgi:hypothetical protein
MCANHACCCSYCRRGLRLRAYSGYTSSSFPTDYSGLTLTFDQVQPTVNCPALTSCLALADDETSNWAVQVRGAASTGRQPRCQAGTNDWLQSLHALRQAGVGCSAKAGGKQTS